MIMIPRVWLIATRELRIHKLADTLLIPIPNPILFPKFDCMVEVFVLTQLNYFHLKLQITLGGSLHFIR